MNYLALCDTLIKEVGLEESGVSSVVSQTGIKKKVVDWVSRAWVEIQNKRNWNFLWEEGSFNTVIGQQSYHPVSNLALSPTLRSWDSASLIHSISGESKFYLQYVPWERFDNTLSGSGTPTEFTIKPDSSLKFNAAPSVIGTVNFEYTRVPQVLAANTDVPILPTHHHEVIFYQAMMYLAAEQDAPEMYQDASMQLRTRLASLAAETLPNITVGSVPLA